jgi:hypothetical protein
LIGINLLAMAGFPRLKNEMIVLLSNRHLVLEKYQNQLLLNAARARQETVLDKALRQSERDSRYPAWSDRYPRDVVSREAHGQGAAITSLLLEAMPAAYVSDPSFDFGVKESGIDLAAELDRQGASSAARRSRMDNAIAELLANFGAHSRNLVRGVLKAGTGQ